MKRTALIFSACLVLPVLAFAQNNRGLSEHSLLGSMYVAAVPLSVLVVSSVVVSNILNDSVDPNKVRVEVGTDKGGKETISLPKSIVDKAKLKEGDQLTVKPTRSGAMLSKNETPIAYLVTPENAKLSRSHELAR